MNLFRVIYWLGAVGSGVYAIYKHEGWFWLWLLPLSAFVLGMEFLRLIRGGEERPNAEAEETGKGTSSTRAS
jgi:hypothetical protein